MQKANVPTQLSRGIASSITTAFMMGFFLGIVIIVGISKADDRISSVTELYEQFNLPVLAQVPKMKMPAGAERLALLQATDERKVLAESYRNLRSSLLFLPGKQKLKSLIVTSSVPKEGKSTVSANLAVTMALAETHVLLVDADLRLGHLANDFGLKARVGLSDVLEQKLTWQEALLQTQFPHLHLLPCGAPMHTPGDYLLNDSIDVMIKQMEKHYSIVIFDTAPILAADDTATLAPRTDGVLMVFRADYTTARQAKYCIESMQQRQIDILGMVLNGFSEDMPDYYYYRYKDYYNV
jgi:capsular exopolysaccharide synthesis family protein